MKNALTLTSLSIELAVRFPSLAKFLRFDSIDQYDSEVYSQKEPLVWVMRDRLSISDNLLTQEDSNAAKISLYTGLISIISRQFLVSTYMSHSSTLVTKVGYSPLGVDTNLLYIAFDLMSLNLLNTLNSMTSKSLFSGALCEFSTELKDLLVAYNEFLNTDEYNATTNDITQVTVAFINSRNSIIDVAKLVDTGISRFNFNEHKYSANPYIKSEYENDINTSDNSRGRGAGSGNASGPTGLSEIFTSMDFIRELTELTSKLGANPLLRKFLVGYSFSLSRLVVNYEERLSDVFGGLFKDDYSYRKPNSRYLHSGIIMPTMHSNLVKLVFAVDHSASVTNSESAEQLGAIDSILDNYSNHESQIVVFATEIRKVMDFTSNESLVDRLGELGEDIGGKGGTTFQCVFDHCDNLENLDEINLITLVSSDGEGGDITLSEHFKDTFKGRILLLLKDNISSQNAAVGYKEALRDVELDVVFYVPKK